MKRISCSQKKKKNVTRIISRFPFRGAIQSRHMHDIVGSVCGSDGDDSYRQVTVSQ
jgi:hypothetical protein